MQRIIRRRMKCGSCWRYVANVERILGIEEKEKGKQIEKKKER